METTREIWFPLRSNIAFFESGRRRMGLDARVKQSVILCDELFFEAGMVTIDVTEHFVVGPIWHSPSTLSWERIAEQRRASKRGEQLVMSITPEPAPGVAARLEQTRTMGGSLQRGFVAEFHQLLRNTKLGDEPWVHLAEPASQAAQQISDIERNLDQFDFGLQRLAPRLASNSLLDGVLKKSLNHDLAIATAHGMPAAIDKLHSRMLRFKAKHSAAVEGPEAGGEALELWIPDFSDRPWADIIALHDHDAIGAFRAKLVEAEREVAGLRGRQRERALTEIGFREVTEAVRKRFPSLKKATTEVAFDVASGLILGHLSPIFDLAKSGATVREAQSEWTAVWLALRERQSQR